MVRPALPPHDDSTNDDLHEERFVGGRDLTHWYTPVARVVEPALKWASARLGPYATLVVVLAVGMVIAAAFSVAVAQVYDSVTDSDGVAGFDQPLLDFALTLRTPVVDSVVTGYTDLAGPVAMPVIAILALLILSIRRRSWTPVILILAAGGGSLLMTIAGKDLIDRVRPPIVDAVPPYEFSPSFPSGHSLNAVVIAGVIAYLLVLRQRSGRARVLTVTVAAVFAFTVGVSRVFLGHHWFTDVLAGWFLGALWLALVITAHRLYLTAKRLREQGTGAAPSASPPRRRGRERT